MSERWDHHVRHKEEQPFLGATWAIRPNYWKKRRRNIDAEVKRIVMERYESANKCCARTSSI